MRKPILLLALTILSIFYGCENKGTNTKTPGANKAVQVKKEQSPLFFSEGSMQIDSSEYVMYPLTDAAAADREDDSYIVSKRSGDGYFWNIAFYNTSTKAAHLLDDKRKMIIQKFTTSSSTENIYAGIEYLVPGNLIYYLVITTDFNHDGKINANDPSYLFTSDKTGHNFKQVSPEGIDVTAWQITQKTNKVLIQAIDDTNGDKRFDKEDGKTQYVYDINTGKVAESVFDEAFKENAETLFNKQWPVKE